MKNFFVFLFACCVQAVSAILPFFVPLVPMRQVAQI